MALKATIYKAVVNVADLDRNQFLDANLTLAQHPSETQERMMLRLLAWIKYANERLQFTRGLSSDDEPELWQLNDHLGIDLWIELGAAGREAPQESLLAGAGGGAIRL
ncbi:YaeQ protein [Klebsiella aerogenes]|nr:YaeQ protein [Klebsiella aerogenes]